MQHTCQVATTSSNVTKNLQGIDGKFPNIDANTKISTLFYKVLGSNDFTENLQLLTAKENSLKAAIWGLYENINADKKWNKMSPTTRLVSIYLQYLRAATSGSDNSQDVLWRLKTVVNYLNSGEVSIVCRSWI